VSFTTPTSAVTEVTFGSAGTYVLRLTADDGELESSSDVTVVVQPAAPVNQPPAVNAGFDQTITQPTQTATLNGTVGDDGKPNATPAVSWSQVGGPSAVSFANPAQAHTTVTLGVAGTYVLRLTASDGELTSSDDVTIVLQSVANQAPSVSAGADQTLTL